MRIRTLILAMLVILGGCGGSSNTTVSAPARDDGSGSVRGDGGNDDRAVDAVDQALLDQVAIGLEDVLGSMVAITESAADCPAMATQLRQLFDQSSALFTRARTLGADPQTGPALTARFNARTASVEPLVKRISHALARCQLDADVAAVIELMPTL